MWVNEKEKHIEDSRQEEQNGRRAVIREVLSGQAPFSCPARIYQRSRDSSTQK